VIFFLSGCQGDNIQIYFKKPIYEEDFQQIEQILNYADQENYEGALAKNKNLERRFDDSINSDPDYSRVIMSFTRMNDILLWRVIQNQNNFSKESKKNEQLNLMNKKKNEQLNLMNKKLNITIDELTRKLKGMKIALKTVERLKLENETLLQQIEDFKKIDLQSDKIDDVI
jgi:hypothetical protein